MIKEAPKMKILAGIAPVRFHILSSNSYYYIQAGKEGKTHLNDCLEHKQI